MIESNNPLVSVITTFFNEENYLDRCLTSISKQTYPNIEVILINDGSVDSSLKIAEKFFREFSKCKLLCIENSGHAEARNIGVFEATGEYITFLDADDMFEPTMIETFARLMTSEGVDLVDGNYIHINEDSNQEYPRKWVSSITQIQTTRELVPELYKGNLQPVVWAKMFKTSIAKQIRFDKGLWFDDWPFTLEYLFKANTVSFVEQKLLRVYGRKTSITRRTLEPKRIYDVNRVLELTTDIHKRYNSYNEFKYASFRMILNYYIENFLIYLIDLSRIGDIEKVNNSFVVNVNKLKIHVRNEKIKISIKERILLFLLSQPNKLILTIAKMVFIQVKKNSYDSIKKIKQLT